MPVGGFGRSVAVLAGGTALGQALALLAAPILTRLYTPEDFGILGVYASLLGICAAIASLRYEYSIPIPESDRDAAALTSLALAIIPIAVGSMTVITFLLSDQIINWTSTPAFAPYLWMLPIGIALWSTYNVLTFWAIRKKNFHLVATTKVSQSIATIITQAVLFPIGAPGLLVGHMLSGAIGISSLRNFIKQNNRDAFRAVKIIDATRNARQFRKFALYGTPSGLVNAAGLLSPVLLLAASHGPEAAGQLALLQRIAAAPLRLIGTAINKVYFAEAASEIRKGGSSLNSLYLKTSKRLGTAALASTLLMFVFGPTVFPLLFGEQWIIAARWSRPMAIMLGVQLIASPLSQTLNALQLQAWQLGWDVTRLSFITLAFALGAYNTWSADIVVTAYLFASGISYVLLWAIGLLAVIQKSPKKMH